MIILTEDEKMYLQFLDWIEFFKNVKDIINLEFKKAEVYVPLNNDYLEFFRLQLEEMQFQETIIDRDSVKGVTNPVLKLRKWLIAMNNLWMIYYKGVSHELLTGTDLDEIHWTCDELEEQLEYLFPEDFRLNIYRKITNG